MKNKILTFLMSMVFGSSLFLSGCSLLSKGEQQEEFLDAVNSLKQSNSRLNCEEALGIIKEANYKWLLNSNDVWSNMKVTTYSLESVEDLQTTEYYKTDDGEYVLITKDYSSQQVVSEEVAYTTGSNDVEERVQIYSKEGGKIDLSTTRYFNYDVDYSDLAEAFNLSEETFATAKVLDNGNSYALFVINNEIVAGDKTETVSMIMELEVNSKGFFEKVKMTLGVSAPGYFEPAHDVPIYGVVPETNLMIFEYGTVNGTEVETKLQEVKDYVAAHSGENNPE